MARLTPFSFLSDQFTKLPPVDEVDLSGKTVVVIGANTGLGFEASKHFARMTPGRLILACRNSAKGAAAIEELAKETGYGSAELWLIDLSDFASVKAFADKFDKDGGGRLDILVENAAVFQNKYEATTDGWESSFQVNNLSLSLLALLLLPRMIQTGKDHATRPRLVVVTSELHMLADVKRLKNVLEQPNILKTFGSKEHCTSKVMTYRYNDTKLLNVFFARALTDRIPASPHSVIVNSVNPGFCFSELRRDITGIGAALFLAFQKVLARTTEQGSRQLVYAAVCGRGEREDDMRGAYINCSRIGEVGDFVVSEAGGVAQDRIWDDLVEVLGEIDPRVRTIVADHLATPKK